MRTRRVASAIRSCQPRRDRLGEGIVASTQTVQSRELMLSSVSGRSTRPLPLGLVVRDALQRDMGNYTTDFFAFFVLLAFVDKPTAGPRVRHPSS